MITTGIEASGDGQGFPARYLEQDPLAQAVITTIVDGLGISVCVGAGDGVMRDSSIAAFGKCSRCGAGAAEPMSPTGAFVAYDTADGSPTAYRVFTSDVAANTFSSPFDLSGGLDGANVSRVNQVVYEVGGGIGLAGFGSNDFCAPPILEEFDTAGRIAYARPGLGFGDPFSMAIDHGPDVVAVAKLVLGRLRSLQPGHRPEQPGGPRPERLRQLAPIPC